MGSAAEYHYEQEREQEFERKMDRAKEREVPFALYSALEDLEALTRKNRNQYSYEFGLKLNAIMNQIKEYL